MVFVDDNFDDARSIYVADMDRDGDMDVLGASKEFNHISWWENDGTPNNADWTEYKVEK